MKKTALITGASSEVGSSISKVLASNNINIIIHYNTNYESASELEKEIKENYNVDVLLIKADLTKEEEINKLVEESLNKFNKIDILINNAALDKPNLFSEKTSKAYKESATSYKKLFESKEFYNAIMKSLGNVIYRILNSDDTIKYSERSEEDSNTELKVAEDSEEYKITDKEDENG